MSPTPRPLRLLPLLLLLSLTAGCEMLGIETPGVVVQQKQAEGKAIGSACRHALRAIEDCYTLNPKAVKASVYGGWREMDEYMRENKLEGLAPVVPRPDPHKPTAAKDDATDAHDDPADAKSGKATDKDKAGAGADKHAAKGKADAPAKDAHAKPAH